MGKSLLGLHKELAKKKPMYKAMQRLHSWYVDHPFTPGAVATKIKDLHEHVETEQMKMDERHAQELLPILKTVQEAQEKAKAMGLVHRKEKEDITMGFAQIEWDLLQGNITELPPEIPRLDSTPSVWWKIAKWFLNLVPKKLSTQEPIVAQPVK